jgi:hypothetical protein
MRSWAAGAPPLPLRLLLVWLSHNIGRQGAELHGHLCDIRAGFAWGVDR